MRGKLILIEGTDCSGKETQTKQLVDRLNNENIWTERLSFPMYDTPTGRIIGACYLGKEYLCDQYFKDGINGWFSEGASNVDPYVAIDLYAADRRYNKPKIEELLNKGVNVVLDRYVESNMAHQGGKILDKKERTKLIKLIYKKEYLINEMPKPDMTVFLYVPYEYACLLKKNREEKPDQHEMDSNHLKRAEDTYLELCDMFKFTKIDCVKDNYIRSINDINEEVYRNVKKLIKK